MDEQGRTGLRRFLMGLLLVAVIFALVWFVFLRDSGKKDDATRTQNPNASQNASKENDAKSSAHSGAATGSSSGSQAGGAQTGSDQNSSGASQLAATGPGNLVTVFLSTAAIAAFGHYLYTRRKQSRD